MAAKAGEPSLRDRLSARIDAAPSTVWSLGWTVLTCAALGLLLAVFGRLTSDWLLALLVGAAPGVIGVLWKPKGQALLGLLTVWSLASAFAAGLTGGLTGPLCAWCLTPLLAAVALGGLLMDGAVFSAVALALAAFAGLMWRTTAPQGWLGLGFSAAGIAPVLAAASCAVLIRHRKLTEAEREGAAEIIRLQTLLGELPYLALALDAAGQATAVFGQPLSMMDHNDLRLGLAPAVAAADQDRVGAAVEQAREHGAAEVSFHPVSKPDQQVHATLRATGDGGMIALLRELDITHADLTPDEMTSRMAQLETARLAAEHDRTRTEETLRARSRFLANMSHELRTPLNAIMGFSDIMRVRMFGEMAPKYGEYAELIHESGRHLMDLISDVLDMSKIDAERFVLSLEVFDARDAVNAALRLTRVQADEVGVKLRGVLPSEPLMVDADKRAMKQIVLNLVSNALKFTPRGGNVTVTAQVAGDALEIVVADSGIGIDKADLQRLGKPFEQAGDPADRARGTGLGLSLVKAFAELHGGEMHIESQLGEGTAVTVRLPVLAKQAPPSDGAEDGKDGPSTPPSDTGQVIPMPPRGS